MYFCPYDYYLSDRQEETDIVFYRKVTHHENFRIQLKDSGEDGDSVNYLRDRFTMFTV